MEVILREKEMSQDEILEKHRKDRDPSSPFYHPELNSYTSLN